MELIDRDALMRKHTRSAHGNRHDTAEELQCLLELIENAPTVDRFCPCCGAKMTGDFIYELETGEQIKEDGN